MTPNLALSSLLAFAGFALPAAAQTYTAAHIKFSDPGSFTQAQLEDVSGIHAGTSFDAKALGAAAQRLVDTGYFDDAGATLDGKITAVTVLFTTKHADTAHMLPVGFTNFVWLTHDEIEAAIKAKLPLFCDYLPESSPHADDVKAALTAALAAKSVKADIEYETIEPTLRHPVRAIAFRVATPAVRVANVKLAGATPAVVPLVQKSVNGSARTAYTEGPADVTTADRILQPLLDAGYIDATLTDVQPTPGTAADGSAAVTLAARLNAGDIFQVASLSYAGTPIFPAETFNAGAKLHAGDVASRAALLATLAPVDTAYRHQGYLDVVVEAKAVTTGSTVAYTVAVAPGEVYHVHEITPQDLPAAATADFNRYFTMQAGSVYNEQYVKDWLKNNSAIRSLEGYTIAYKAYADPNSHTVDLVVAFVGGKR